MGGRGSGSSAGGSRLARSEAKLTEQIAAAQQADRSMLRNESIPFGENAGGILNDRMALDNRQLFEYDSKLTSANSAWGHSLTPGERQAINDWNQPGVYATLNEAMRNGQTLSPAQAKMRDNLMSAIEKSSVQQTMTVYRGVKTGTTVEQAKALVGTELSGQNMFLATTASWSRAAHFTGDPSFPGGNPEGTMYKITVPKGAKGAWLNSAGVHVFNEHELLLSPNARFRVTGYTRNKSAAGVDTSGSATYNKKFTVIHMVYLGG